MVDRSFKGGIIAEAQQRTQGKTGFALLQHGEAQRSAVDSAAELRNAHGALLHDAVEHGIAQHAAAQHSKAAHSTRHLD